MSRGPVLIDLEDAEAARPEAAPAVPDAYPSLERIRELGCPLLVLHGDRDEIVPVDQGKALFAAAPEPKRLHVFPGAGHNDLMARPQVWQEIGATPVRREPQPDAATAARFRRPTPDQLARRDLERVVAELEACRRAYPDHHIRLLGYDNYTQSQGSAFVVYEGRG